MAARVVGFIALLAGIILLVFGMHSGRSTGVEAADVAQGAVSYRNLGLLVGGAAATVLGFALIFVFPRPRS